MVRSDLILSCSDYEKYLLEKRYKLENVSLVTFFYDRIENKEKLKDIRRRKNFVWIGNQTHEPNEDSLRILVNKIWPKILEKLPEA
jgi:O-antigen biosynthesis protein